MKSVEIIAIFLLENSNDAGLSVVQNWKGWKLLKIVEDEYLCNLIIK